MYPLTLTALQKVSDLLTTDNALQNEITQIGSAANQSIPVIAPSQVILSSAPANIGDNNVQLTYPRVCLYASGLKNTQVEKFRRVSGTIDVVAEIWASDNMVTHTDQWIHFYVEAVTDILSQAQGDWGQGLFFSGVYEVQFQQPKAGGLGFVQSAKVTCSVNVSVG